MCRKATLLALHMLIGKEKNEILPGDDLWRPSLLYNIILRNCLQRELHYYELQTMIADVSAASLLLAVAACTSNVQSSKQDLPC